MTLTDDQRRHLVHCLRVAATQFDHNAQVVRDDAPRLDEPRLMKEYQRYAREARELADSLEDAQSVEVKP